MLWSHSTGLRLDDRGLQFGDGVFETMLVRNGRAWLLDRHLARLRRGCERLGIRYERVQVHAELERALAKTALFAAHDCLVLKLILCADGPGQGYARADGNPARLHLSLHPLPRVANAQPGVALECSKVRLAAQPALAGIKHLNRLEQVMARRAVSRGYHDALMFDADGAAVETTSANLFVVLENRLHTPPIVDCGVQGVFRDWLHNALEPEAWAERVLSWSDLRSASEVFIGNSVRGPLAVTRIAGGGRERPDCAYPIGPWFEQVARLTLEHQASQCGGTAA